jgi:hypothetical protein
MPTLTTTTTDHNNDDGDAQYHRLPHLLPPHPLQRGMVGVVFFFVFLRALTDPSRPVGGLLFLLLSLI